MVRLYCECLNVKLHIKACEQDLNPVEPSTIGVVADEGIDDFFSGKIFVVLFDLEGIVTEYDCLVREKVIGDWKVTKCLNCQTKTHAVNSLSEDTRVLVNAHLKCEGTSVESLRRSSNYSSLYNVVIPSQNDNQPSTSFGPRLGRFENLQQASLIRIQQMLNSYLLSAEAAMEERIRQYEEEQRAAFAELKSRVKREKSRLVHVALEEDEKELMGSLSEAVTEGSTSPLSLEDQETSLSSESSRSEKQNLNIVKSKMPKNESIKLHFSKPPERPMAAQKKSEEADGLFDMDDFVDEMHDHDSRSPDESEEDNDTDDSSYSSDASMRDTNRGTRPVNMISVSLPVRVPVWANRSSKVNQASPDQREAPGDIAASIQALAQSVRVDGTEIFGDLPRGSNKQFRTVEIMKR